MSWAIVVALVLALLWATQRKPRLMASLVWSLTATVFVISAWALLSPAPLKPTLLWLSLVTPLIWAGFLTWAHWDGRAYRPAIGLIVATLAGALAVWQLPPPS